MKRTSFSIVVAGACLITSSLSVQANDGLGSDMGRANCDPGGLVADIELTFMKFLQEGGVTDRDGGGANFDLNLAPRFELGYMGSNDMGIRSRYWFYDGVATGSGTDLVGVNAYTIDAEVFHERCIGRGTHLEFSAGLRYLDFKQDVQGNNQVTLTIGEFEGWGGILGLEAEHPFGVGNVYARGRWSILMGDGDITNHTGGIVTSQLSAHDTTSTLTELGFGYELSRQFGNWGTSTVRLGGEWQTWSNVAPADTVFGGVGNDDVLESAGFAGLVLGMEWRR